MDADIATNIPEAPAYAVALAGTKRTAKEQLDLERVERPQACEKIDRIEQLMIEKLYHEFTDACFDYLNSENSSFTGTERAEFLLFVVGPLTCHLDQCRILCLAQQVFSELEPLAALVFFDKIMPYNVSSVTTENRNVRGSFSSAVQTLAYGSSSKKSQDDGEDILRYSVKARLEATAGLLKKAEESLSSAELKVNTAVSMEPVVRAAFHRAKAEIAKIRNRHSEFYKQALIYLVCTPAASISEKERFSIAYDLSMAALIAPDIYSIAEMLQQASIILALKNNSSYGWLFVLLEAFHYGSIEIFNQCMKEHQQQIRKTELGQSLEVMEKKLATVALLRLAFTRSTTGAALAGLTEDHACGTKAFSGATRTLNFNTIVLSCCVPFDEVESLVMRAMSQGLIKGQIDQVTETVHIQWVRPVLLIDNQSLEVLQDRLCRWVKATEDLHQTLKVQTAELLGS